MVMINSYRQLLCHEIGGVFMFLAHQQCKQFMFMAIYVSSVIFYIFGFEFAVAHCLTWFGIQNIDNWFAVTEAVLYVVAMSVCACVGSA